MSTPPVPRATTGDGIGGQRPAPEVTAAVAATYAAFTGSGLAFASWASRIPQVRDRLQLDPSALGLVLLAVAAGSVVALPLSGTVVARVGSRRTVAAMAVLLGVGLATVAVGQDVGLAVVVLGLFLLGFANGAWDVAMNVQGALVERALGRSIMSRFHAGFSVGTVVGALVGAAAVAAGVSVTTHLLVVAVLVGAAVPVGVRRFLRDAAGDPDGASGPSGARPDGQDGTGSRDGTTGAPGARRGVLAAWREPRTLLVGFVVLAFAFAEGAGNDWISIAVIDGYGLPAAVGTLAFAAFLTAMTAGRWFGPALLDRFGRVAVVRALVVLAVVGVLLFVFAPWPALALVGTLLWGLGASLGFPVGMSAGADEPEHAAARVSVIASIGYCAFLAGPPLLGLLGDRVTVLTALSAVAVLLGASVLLVGALRPPGSLAPSGA